ncbi:hypothetical protein B4U37_03155 [Sutcliffiella horikoshii]|uniref:Uncharacterized protein n=1 Tax=Sutcliffiella horikoshii TaxID=79883 RepID=A0ABN4Z9P9_9BACI|nr:hypothetical protein [Sutcliffiella horikoshii]ART75102.1 hypothetical protein B4U37_03155 [Sutcliffiella horikoshii]
MKQSNDFQSLNQKITMSDKESERVQEQMNFRMNGSPEVRKTSTPRKYYVALASAAMIFMLILIPAIINNPEKSSDSVLPADEIPRERLEEMLIHYNNYEILHIEEVESGVVVFFTYDNKKEINIEMVSAMFVKQTKYGWEDPAEGGEHAIIDQTYISHEFISPINEDSPFPLVFGKIISSDISEVLLRKVDTKQDIKTEKIVSKSGERYWFTFADIKPDEMFEIHGLTRDGQIIYSIDTLFAFGNSPVLEEVNPEAANFELTAEELDVYQQLKTGFNQQLLLDLSPISIAKLFVQATNDKEWELQYELYTDHEDVRRIDKEEYFREMVFPDKDVLFGIQDGTFHDDGDGYGHISYTNIYGQKWGFQMVQENDGSWAVAFVPLQ